MESLLLLAIIAMVGVVCVAGLYGAYLLLNPTRTASDRLRDLGGEEEPSGLEGSIIIDNADDDGAFGGVGRMFAPQSAEERNIMRRKLVQAGYRHKNALEILNFTRIALAIGLPLMCLPLTLELTLIKGGGLTLAMLLFGYFAPQMMVENKLNKRKDEILKSFPDCLDLLVSSVEAGLGVDAAFRRVAQEMESAAPLLAKEFQLVNNEISAGVARIDALRHMEKRTGIDEIRSLVNMLAQAERFGTSIAASLRVHAEVTRQKRMSRAEAEAAKVSPKLTVVMILFLLPTLFMMLTGPAVIRVARLMMG